MHQSVKRASRTIVFCSYNLLFCGVLVSVSVLVAKSSLIFFYNRRSTSAFTALFVSSVCPWLLLF